MNEWNYRISYRCRRSTNAGKKCHVTLKYIEKNLAKNKTKQKTVLTADDDDPELSPLCMTRTLHLTFPFFCFTPNWVQMRTMIWRCFFLSVCFKSCFVSLSTGCVVLKSLRFCSGLSKLRLVWDLYSALLNTAAAARFFTVPLRRPHIPVELSRDRPFPHGMPVCSAQPVKGHWCSSDDHADVAASFSISRLVSGVLEDRPEQTVTTGYTESSFLE